MRPCLFLVDKHDLLRVTNSPSIRDFVDRGSIVRTTGEIPRDPIGRLFSTVQRGQTIPDWAYRDVLYMLIDYSERAYALLYKPLSNVQKQELFEVFLRIGEGMSIPQLPETYQEWETDRRRHIARDLSYSKHTSMLFRQYRKHLGWWRYQLLLEVQAVLVPGEVRRLLRFNSNRIMSGLVQTYGLVNRGNLRSLVHRLLIPPRYWSEVRSFDRAASA